MNRMDDLISRQAAISHVDDIPYIKEHPNVGLLWKAWIESLPAAQPERKKGEWIHDGREFKGGNDWVHCSECGHREVMASRTNFCPNCGADMREKEGAQDD